MQHPRVTALIILVLLTVGAIVSLAHLYLRFLLHPDKQTREMVLGLDGFVNAGMFGGSRWETVSSHTGREMKKGTWWAVWLSRVLHELEPHHCERTNEVEQPVMDLLEKHGHK